MSFSPKLDVATVLSTLESARIGYWSWDVVRDLVFAPPVTLCFLGHEAGEALLPLSEFLARVREKDRARVIAEMRRAANECATLDIQYKVEVRGQGVRFLRSQGEVRCDAAGIVTAIEGITVDVTEHAAALEKVAEAERLYSRLVNSLDGIVWEADGCTFEFSFVSPQAERILGYSIEEWLADPLFWAKHLHPDDRDWCIRFCQERTASGEDHEFEYRMFAADGRIVWLHDIVSVIQEPGKRLCLRGIMVDVTDRKRIESALRDSEQRFRLLFEQSVAAMVIGDLQANVVQSNRAFQQLLGYSEEELARLRVFDFIHPDDHAQVKRNLMAESPVRAVRKFRHKDGHTIWGRLSAVMIKPENKAGYWLGIVQDITAEKLAEEVLRESEERFRIVANDTPAYLWTLTLENQNAKLFVNRKLSEFLGERQAASGVSWYKSIHPDDRGFTIADLERGIAEEREFVQEFRIRRHDGEYRWVLNHGVPRRAPDGRLLGYAGSVLDITDNKLAHEELSRELAERSRAEEQVRQLSERLINAHEEERARIARELHDDLSQQVAVVSIQVSRIKSLCGASSDLISELMKAYDRLLHIAETVRNMSHQLHPVAIERGGLTEAVRAYARELEDFSRVRIDVFANDALADLPSSLSLSLFRVAQEALQNVVKHSGSDSAAVALARHNGEVSLRVSDRGHGFDLGNVESESSGLGLLSMRERMRLAGGTLRIESDSVKGSAVIATVPVGARE